MSDEMTKEQQILLVKTMLAAVEGDLANRINAGQKIDFKQLEDRVTKLCPNVFTAYL